VAVFGRGSDTFELRGRGKAHHAIDHTAWRKSFGLVGRRLMTAQMLDVIKGD
jgi:hypothetical protein